MTNHVQLFLDGRTVEGFNFTRTSRPSMFSRDIVRFDQDLPLEMDDDTHVIVAIMDGNSLLPGPVTGPRHQDKQPVAICNPIFVDVDGNGFQPILVTGN